MFKTQNFNILGNNKLINPGLCKEIVTPSSSEKQDIAHNDNNVGIGNANIIDTSGFEKRISN